MGFINVGSITDVSGVTYTSSSFSWNGSDGVTYSDCKIIDTVDYGSVILCDVGQVLQYETSVTTNDGRLRVSDGSSWYVIPTSGLKIVKLTGDITITDETGNEIVLKNDGTAVDAETGELINGGENNESTSVDTTLVFSTGISEVGTSVSSMVVVALPVALVIAGLFISIKLGIRYFRSIAK